MLARFGTSSGGSGTTYNWPNLEPIQVAFYLDGKITQVIDSLQVMAKIGTNFNCITCWPNLEPIQVAFFLAGEITQVK